MVLLSTQLAVPLPVDNISFMCLCYMLKDAGKNIKGKCPVKQLFYGKRVWNNISLFSVMEIEMR